jgi:hypothetical protein
MPFRVPHCDEKGIDEVIQRGSARFRRRLYGLIPVRNLALRGSRLTGGLRGGLAEIELAGVREVEVDPCPNHGNYEGHKIILTDAAGGRFLAIVSLHDSDVLQGIIRRLAPEALWIERCREAPEAPGPRRMYLEKRLLKARMAVRGALVVIPVVLVISVVMLLSPGPAKVAAILARWNEIPAEQRSQLLRMLAVFLLGIAGLFAIMLYTLIRGKRLARQFQKELESLPPRT